MRVRLKQRVLAVVDIKIDKWLGSEYNFKKEGANNIMNLDIDKHLSLYQKIDFGGDIEYLESDVKSKLGKNDRQLSKVVSYAEELFGVPFVLSGSALASTLIIGIMLGIYFQPVNTNGHSHALDLAQAMELDVFSSSNLNLPSSRLELSNDNKKKY